MIGFLAKTWAGCRRSFSRHLLHRINTLAISTLLVAIPQLVFAASLKAKSSDRPNIVLILADDQSYRDFGFMGNDLVHTPNIDRLAAMSTRFPRGYVSMSVCRPSLATILTGLYPHQHGVHFNHPPPGLSAMRKMSAQDYHRTRATTDYLIQDVPTLPRILASHGYACLQTGKHWEGDYKTAGFTDGMTRGKPTGRLSPVTGTRQQTNGQVVAHGNGDAGLVIGRETMKPIENFVRNNAGRKPLFIWYAPFLPHTPFDAEQRFGQLYQDKPIPTHLLPYYAEIARFDETVGQLLDLLDKHHLREKTLIVLAADNGFRPRREPTFDRHDQRSKLSEFEDGLRTPILICLPGVTRPADHRQPVHTVDLAVTVLSAVGLSGEVTADMKGIDLMPVCRGDEKQKQRHVCGAIYPNDAQSLESPSQHVRGRWIRSENYKLIVPGPEKNPLQESLFDLEEDPEEKTNLIGKPEHAGRIEQLKVLLDRWWDGSNNALVTRPAGQ